MHARHAPQPNFARRKETQIGPEVADERLAVLLDGRFADSTMSNRAAVLDRLQRWAAAHDLPEDADTAVLWVLATGVEKQGQLAYAKSLHTVFGMLDRPRNPLKQLCATLRAQGAAIPQHQAVPIPPDQVLLMAADAEANGDPRLALATVLAWSTMSRWGDVEGLSPEAFIHAGPLQFGGATEAVPTLVLDWWTCPKARAENPFVPSRYVVLSGAVAHEPIRLLARCGQWSGPLTCTTEELDRELKRVEVPYTGHSFKRGAYAFLLSRLNATIPAVRPTEVLISRCLKHRHPADLEGTTLRYAASAEAWPRVQQALSLQTQDVTRWLDLGHLR